MQSQRTARRSPQQAATEERCGRRRKPDREASTAERNCRSSQPPNPRKGGTQTQGASSTLPKETARWGRQKPRRAQRVGFTSGRRPGASRRGRTRSALRSSGGLEPLSSSAQKNGASESREREPRGGDTPKSPSRFEEFFSDVNCRPNASALGVLSHTTRDFFQTRRRMSC